jgi:5-methylthioadenosine/S-adenosylhomocysteine deaminase
LPELLAAGVRAGLGTGGGSTSNRLSVFEEMRMAALLQRGRLLDGRALPADRAFALGTRGGAELLGLDAGLIAPGRLADLVAVDLEHASLHPRSDLLRSVVYAMSPQAVTDVWVHGRRVVEEGELVSTDLGELLARVRELTSGWRL